MESLENHRLIDDILSTKRVLNAPKNSEDVLTSSFGMIFITATELHFLGTCEQTNSCVHLRSVLQLENIGAVEGTVRKF